MRQFDVGGMSCAACSARVEKAVSSLPGVSECAVNLLTNSMGVDGSVTDEDVIKAVQAAGYSASPKGKAREKDEASPEDGQSALLKKRLLVSLGFLTALMYISMGHVMWALPLPTFLDNPISVALSELLLAVSVMVINQHFFISGYKALFKLAPNMDSLVALGSSAAFVYSSFILFKMGADTVGAHEYLHELYFESAAMILTLITVGKMLEAHSKGKTTNALKALMDLSPKTACVIKEGREQIIPIAQMKKGDVFLVRPGEKIPADAEILEGGTAVDESALTGESIPVDKTVGDSVSAATLNRMGFIRCRAVKVGEETVISQVIRMVSDAAATKAPIARTADKVAGVFVPVVMAIAAITTLVWLLTGSDLGFAMGRGISVLVISCPCALGLATPVAIMVGSGVGAKQGILFKTAAAIENAGRTEIVVLDKTGTVTSGKPSVCDVIGAKDIDSKELLSLAAALESRSEHPLAKAIMLYAEEEGISYKGLDDFQALPGSGLEGSIDGKKLRGGSLKYISEQIELDKELRARAEDLSEKGKTPLLFAMDETPLGIIAVSDSIKPDSAEAVKELKNMGIRVVMLTGDNALTAAAVGRQAGIDEVIAGVLPDAKDAAVRRFAEQGHVAMIGDGINDAPALKRADVGIAIGAGADIAIDAADAVLVNGSLRDAAAAIRLGRATLRNIRQNLFWAFFYNSVSIPIAAGALSGLGLTLSPMIGAAAMSLSSFCVVSNALRLNLCDIHDARGDKKIKHKKEDKAMERTMKIEGMMCPHCQARVKKALEAIDGVEVIEVSHEKNQAVVKVKDVSDELLKKAVEAQDYTVKEIV